jgi:DNA repair exonuclease SbcCD ATPase subunit
VIAALDEREERVARLRAEIETLLRDGSAELDQRHAELAVEANALRERETALARAAEELEARRSELGAVELRRAAAERLEEALQRRQADLERASGELRERAAQLDERERETQAQIAPETPAGRTDMHVLVVARDGYRIVEAPGPAPDAGSELVLAGDRFTVTRTGPSPLPGDDRRCAFLERATG